MSYRLTPSGNFIIRLADHAFIPVDPANGDWQRYQAWLGLGNVAEPPDPPPPGPKWYCPVWLARRRLEDLGLWDDLIAILFQPPYQPMLAKVLSLEIGIDPDDPQAQALIAAVGADPAVILAPEEA